MHRGITLKVIKYKEAKDFLIEVKKFLEEKESVNNVVLISSGKFRIGEKSDLETISRWIIDLEKDEGSNITEEKAVEIAQYKIKSISLIPYYST